MKHYVLSTLFLLITSVTLYASETRGLRVVAKDPITNQTGEVKLYNKSYAVIIGIDRYQNLPSDRQLKNAVSDAKGVEAVLSKNFRFDKIIHLYNQDATKDRILELLTEELPAQMGDQDSLFLFWAGHGDQEKGAQGKEIGYLIPYDGEVGKIRKNLTMTELRDTISTKLPAKHVFYVMDACYGGLLASTRAVDKKSRRDLSYLKEITKENVRQVLTAGGKGEEVLDGGYKGHSVFTGRLVEALEASGDFITANEIQAILREKVYGDSKTLGHGRTQTPAFGTLSGNGDYVFVPNIKDSEAEIAKMTAELKALELSELQSQDEQKRLEAGRQKRAVEARIRAAELKKKLELEEQQRNKQDEQKRVEAEANKKSDAERLARIKAELERKKQQLPAIKTNSIESALAEIRRINVQITELDNKAAPARDQINSHYASKTAELNAQQQDEFEKASDFRGRIEKELGLLESRKQNELNELAAESTALLDELKRISEMEYTLEAAQVHIQLGKYDVEKERFPIILKNKQNIPVVIAMNGTIRLPSQQARTFKQQFESGLIRPEIQARPNGEVLKVALVNDVDNCLLVLEDGEFLTAAGWERKKVVSDTSTGLMWARNGNITGKEMNWNDAIAWAKNLSYGGYSDWRLPTKDELETFSKRDGSRPSEWFNANGFKSVQASSYWSSSTYAHNTDDVLSFNMRNGDVGSNGKAYSNYVWPVRSIQKSSVSQTTSYSKPELGNPTKNNVKPTSTNQTTDIELVTVPGGCFRPKWSEVCLDAFRIGKYEVTQGQWQQIMGSNPSKFSNCGDDCPVEQVSWDDVNNFIQRLNSQSGRNYRLPTESEWEYACRSGGKNEEYCGGNDVDAFAWYKSNCGEKTHVVGKKQPNGLGIFDMSGNVYEWVSDWYGSDYPSSALNPTGTSSGSRRVARGGSLYDAAEYLRAAERGNFTPGFRAYVIGFRLAAPAQ